MLLNLFHQLNNIKCFVLTAAKEGKKLQSKIKKIAKKVEQDDFDDELEMV